MNMHHPLAAATLPVKAGESATKQVWSRPKASDELNIGQLISSTHIETVKMLLDQFHDRQLRKAFGMSEFKRDHIQSLLRSKACTDPTGMEPLQSVVVKHRDLNSEQPIWLRMGQMNSLSVPCGTVL